MRAEAFPAGAAPDLTVAVDARFASSSGIGVYIRNILAQLYELRPGWRFRLLGAPEEARAALARPGRTEFEPLDARYYSISEQVALWRRIGRGADLAWSPHYNAAVLAPAPLLVTVHDVNHLALPELVHGVHRRLYARLMFQGVRRRAAGLMFVSEFSRAEFRRLVGPARAPSWITPNAVGRFWTDEAPGLRLMAEPYIVYVGNVKPHKNLVGLLKAYALLTAHFDHRLIIVGRREGFLQGDPEVGALAETIGADRIRFTGQASDQDLKAWVAGAAALVLPSFYEGFGLPPLEAMAVGCPTVVSNAASLPEVCGPASEYVNPHDPADIARGIARVLGDPAHADALRQAGRARVRQFSWASSAATVAEAMETVARRR